VNYLDNVDRGELASVFRQHSTGLFQRANFLLQGDDQRASDLVQEVFLAAARDWARFSSYHDEHRVRWLYRVLHNKYVDEVRAGQREPRAELPERDWPAADETATQALHAVTLEKCWAVIMQMPTAQHQVAVLSWSAGWTTAEIAAHLGIARSTVRVHQMKARKRLLDMVGDGGE
jgi:RNA polymerase sigma-70 factor (ECF subfamily)